MDDDPSDDFDHQHLVGPAEEGRRLDRFLAGLHPDVPRARFQEWIRSGQVRVDGERRRPAHRLRLGETVGYDLPRPETVSVDPEPIPLAVLHEDEAILVIDKQAGLTVHPAPHQPSGTLVNALLHRGSPLSDFHGDPFRPGIVHRLDRGTSGVIVVAKTRQAHFSLAVQFESRTVDKEYRAIVLREPEHEEGEIDLPIGKDRKVQGRMAVRREDGVSALTRFRVLERFGRYAHLAVYLFTGRTHQIRVHLSARGHPVAADALYGGGPADLMPSHVDGEPRAGDEKPLLARPALHAFRLALDHPGTGERMRFTAPLHPDMEALLALLRETARRGGWTSGTQSL